MEFQGLMRLSEVEEEVQLRIGTTGPATGGAGAISIIRGDTKDQFV